MFGKTYYHDTLRKYVILFGTLFNDIWINREDESGNIKQSLKVPLSYSPREKMLARIEGLNTEDPLQQPFSAILPRMGFEITGFRYAADRKLPTRNKFVIEDTTTDNKVRSYQYNPVPYDIDFSLSIFVKNTTDGTRIVEQILPFFTPEWTTTVQLIETPNVTLDIPLILNDTNQDDVYEGSFEERRSLIWTLNLTMKGFFFGPVYKQSVINLANTQLLDATLFADIDTAVGQAQVSSRILNQPGLLANNTPTIYTTENAIQATAVASIANGAVTQIDLINPGAGYLGATVTVSDPVSGTTAAAAATIGSGDSLDSIVITNPGVGYIDTPNVTISPPDLISLAATEIASTDNYGIAVTKKGPNPDQGS